jgi:hypothetical protein
MPGEERPLSSAARIDTIRSFAISMTCGPSGLWPVIGRTRPQRRRMFLDID